VIQQIVSFGAGEGVARGLNWGMMALLPFFLSTEEYGMVGLLVSIEILLSNVSLLGLDRAVLRFYAKDKLPGRLLTSILTVWAILAWIPLAAVFVLYLLGWKTLFSIPLAPHLFLLSVIVATSNLNVLCTCIGRAEHHLAIFLRFRLCYMALKFTCVLVMAKMLGNSLSYVIGIGVSAFVMLIMIVPFLHRRANGRRDNARVRQLVTFGWPFIFHVISGNIISYVSRFFLVVQDTAQDVGVFTFAYTLGSGLFVIYAVLSTYFEPQIYSHADDKLCCEKWLAFYTNVCIALASFGGAMLLIVYPYLQIYLSSDYGRGLPVISMVMGTVLLRPLYLQGNYRLTAYNKTHYIAVASFLGACLSIALNFLLIPRYGIWGAAMALYVASALVSAFILVVSLRVSRILLRQQHSLRLYLISALGSLSALVWANHSRIVILVLLMVCLLSSVLLVRSFLALRERTRRQD